MSTTACPADAPTVEQTLAWRDRLYAARSASDPTARREAMAALVRESLAGTGIVVKVAGSSSLDQVAVEDYAPAPAVNFDVDLNRKKSVQLTPQTVPRSLANNAGYYFTKDRIPYVVIGPRALDSRGPMFIREYAEHELYHAEHHVGDSRPQAERELETWVHGFERYFHRMYPHHMQWGPMLTYYGQSSAGAQQAALDRLLAYYNSPPVPPVAGHCVDTVKQEFRNWVEQRSADRRTASFKLVQDLQKELGISLATLPATAKSHVRYWVGAGDVNGDGRDEVFRWNSLQQTLVINDESSGTPKELASRPFAEAPSEVRVVDLDGDGSKEVLFAEGLPGYNPRDGDQTPVRINIYKPLQPGGWTPETIFTAESGRPQVTGLEVVDFDGDGRKDIVFSYFSEAYMVDFAIARHVNGQWRVEKLPPVRLGSSMAIADLLGNGKPTLVLGRPYAEQTPADSARRRPTLGDAFLVVEGKRVPLPVYRGVSAIAVGDVTGDRSPEIIVGDGWHSDYGKVARGRLAVMRRVGSKWQYELIDDVSSEMRAEQIALADFDGDSKNEIVVFGEKRTPFQKSAVRVYRRQADGWRRTTIADSTSGFAIADIDGDGRKEIVLAAGDSLLYRPNLARTAWQKPEPAVETSLSNPAELVGKPAAELHAEEWTGGPAVTLASLRGKIVLLDYWATWCKPCIEAFPELKRLRETYGPSGFAIVGMTNHSQQTPAEVRQMVARLKLPWPTAIDSKSRSHLDFGVQNLPHQVLVDQKGNIHSYYVGGGATIDAMERDIKTLLGKQSGGQDD